MNDMTELEMKLSRLTFARRNLTDAERMVAETYRLFMESHNHCQKLSEAYHQLKAEVDELVSVN